MNKDKNQKPVVGREEFAGAFVETAFSNEEIERTVAAEVQIGMRDGGAGGKCEFLHGPAGAGKVAGADSK